MAHELDFEEDVQLQHPIIQQHKKLIEVLSDDRVVAVMCNNQRDFMLLECCDTCFGHDLTKAECLELSELFKEIATEIEKQESVNQSH